MENMEKTTAFEPEIKSSDENIQNQIPVQEPAPMPQPQDDPAKQQEFDERQAEPSSSAPQDTPVQSAIAAVPEQPQPSRFTLTAKQLWSVIKNFFSKNCVDAIAAQYGETLPIWGILLPAFVLLGAIDATVSFNSSGIFSSEITSVISSKISFGSGEVFFVTLAINFMLAFAMPLGVRALIKFHKGDGHFLSSANLVTASFLPQIMFFIFNIVTAGALSSVMSPLRLLGEIATFMLLFAGISKALGGKKPIWSFFLMVIIAVAAAFVVAMIVVSPILFSRFAFSIIDSMR